MITQEYTTTLDAVLTRLENGSIDKISISLSGIEIEITSRDKIKETWSESQSVQVREYRHGHRFQYRDDDCTRHIRLHDSTESLDGTI